jgi:putative transposase
MKFEMGLTKVREIFNIIHEEPSKIIELLRVDIKENVGRYLSELMKIELSNFLGREPYERSDKEVNHRNGSYDRSIMLPENMTRSYIGSSFSNDEL